MKIINCEQYSHEWWSARRGIPTASALDKIINPLIGRAQKFHKYAYELAAEIVSGDKVQSFQSAAMTRGLQLEDEARKFLEIKLNADIKKVGFIVEEFSENNQFGCSPDGLIGDDIGVEIKCPLPATHVEYILNKDHLINEYYMQCFGSLIVTKRKKWILCSYCPGMREQIVEVNYDEHTCNEIIKKITEFNEYKNKIIEKIKGE